MTESERDLDLLCADLLAENEKLSNLWSAMKAERDQLREDYQQSCNLVANMHEAAVGYIGGPKQGVVEDVLNLRNERDQLRDHIHTCGPNCTKAGCVNIALRKELAELRQEIDAEPVAYRVHEKIGRAHV